MAGYLAIVLAAAFLAVYGQRISDRIASRRRLAWINQRITATTRPGERAAWRDIRDRNHLGDQ